MFSVLVCIPGAETVSELLCIDIDETQNGQKIKETILTACNLTQVKNIVLKVCINKHIKQ